MEEELQYFITNRPPKAWDAQSVLDRILLHWDTETGVFGIKDNTFHEDKVRYKSISGAMSHVSLLKIAWDCLYAPVFEQYWKGEPMTYELQDTILERLSRIQSVENRKIAMVFSCDGSAGGRPY